MKRSIFILGIVLLVGILIAPVSAGFGNFSSEGEGYQDDLMFSPTSVGASPSHIFNNLYFKEISYFNKLTAIRYYWLPRENMTVTGESAGYPSLPPAGNTSHQTLIVTDYSGGLNRTIATGEIGWSMADTDRDTYVYLFFNTWDTEGLVGERYLQLWYNFSAGTPRFNPHVVAVDPTWGDNFVTIVQDPTAPRWFIPVEGIRVEYADAFENGWENIPTGNFYYDNIKIDRTIDGITYRSNIKINQTDSGGMNHTLIDDMGVGNLYLSGVYNQNTLYIECTNPVNGNVYSVILYTEATYPGSGDLYVYTYDGSTASLLNGATVIKTDLDDPSLNGWGTSGISAPGRTDFQGVIGHSYNLSATSTGFSTAYANYTLTTFPAIVKLYLFPTIGASTLEFYVTANSTGFPLSGVPVKITNTTGTQGKMTVAGFARFGTVSGFNYGWTVAEGMGTCDNCYQPVSGNVTATAGQTRIEIVLSTYGEAAGGVPGGGGPSTPHQAAEDVMETIYSMLPSLLMLVFIFIFLGVMGYNPGRMMRR